MERKSSIEAENSIIKKYLMKLPGILVVILLCFFVVSYYRVRNLSPLFFFLYVYFFCGVIVILELTKRNRIVIPGAVIAAVILIILYRDLVLTVNISLALAAVLISCLLVSDKIRKIGFPIFVLVNILFWIFKGTDNKLLVLCLIIGAFYSFGLLLKKDMDYRYIVIMAFTLILFIPVKEEPFQWTFVKNVFYYSATFIENLLNEVGYRVNGVLGLDNSYSGYSDVATLNGAIREAERDEIEFRKNGGSKTLYLKGAYYDGFSSEGLTDKEKFDSDYNEWLVLYINAVMNSGVNPGEILCFSKIESAEVEYRYIYTEDIICPSNILKIDKELENGLDHKVGKNFYYSVQYMVFDYASPYYMKVIDSIYDENISHELHDYEEARLFMSEVYKVSLNTFMSQERYEKICDEYENRNFERYLDTSMSTDRIRELTQELTSDCDNDYSKAKVIEAYIRQFKYDRSVDLRDSDNYIDTFLFDKQSGYCVHYASAMVMMLREAGIPARFVNGYLYNVNDDKCVKSSDAHSWAEAYIEGIGWISFEPTATKKNSEDLTWGLVSMDDNEYLQIDWSEYYQQHMSQQYIPEQYRQERDENAGIVEDREETVEESKKKSFIDAGIMKRIILYVLVILGAAALIILLFIISRAVWFHFLTPERKLQELVRKECRNIEKHIESPEIILALRSNTASLYDYLEYEEDEAQLARIKKMLDLYYIVRFRGDKIEEKDVKDFINRRFLIF